ncbi:hypothetical protein DS67_05415 [Mesotoga sp. SC_4PWA21]|nr:hypothetical protein DS67_05415 [Mesotoga sp. SC_4PWA21]
MFTNTAQELLGSSPITSKKNCLTHLKTVRYFPKGRFKSAVDMTTSVSLSYSLTSARKKMGSRSYNLL